MALPGSGATLPDTAQRTSIAQCGRDSYRVDGDRIPVRCAKPEAIRHDAGTPDARPTRPITARLDARRGTWVHADAQHVIATVVVRRDDDLAVLKEGQVSL